jgi:hypothetical protein
MWRKAHVCMAEETAAKVVRRVPEGPIFQPALHINQPSKAAKAKPWRSLKYQVKKEDGSLDIEASSLAGLAYGHLESAWVPATFLRRPLMNTSSTFRRIQGR